MPEDIPVAPYKPYKNKGWHDWGDWLGKQCIIFLKKLDKFKK